MMCSRCKTRPAVMFISTVSGTERKSEGLCLQCAKELGLPQVSEYLKQMGISEDDLENACDSLFGENGEVDGDFLKQLFRRLSRPYVKVSVHLHVVGIYYLIIV